METEVYREEETAFSLVFSKNQWKSKERHIRRGYGVRVLEQGRLGFSHCQNESELEETVKKAKAVSRFGPPSRFSFSEERGKARIKTEDRKLKALGMEEMKAMLEGLRAGARPYAEHVRIYAGLSHGRVSLRNPHWEKGYAKTEFGVYAEATAGEGNGFYHFSGIGLPREEWEGIGERVGKTAQKMQHAKRPASGEYDAVFSPEAFASLLEVFLPSFSGDWKRRGISPWASKIGKKVFDERFSMYEQGNAATSGARPFDDEGVPSKAKALVENGVLKAFEYDRETASLEGMAEEGQCTRASYDAGPSVGGAGYVIAPGEVRRIEEETKEYLYIRSLHGTHTANTTTGDFGAEVNMAFRVNGDSQEPLRGFLLTENVFNLFRRIKCIERKPQVYDNLSAPLVLFGNLKVVS